MRSLGSRLIIDTIATSATIMIPINVAGTVAGVNA
jgi:hypothetical protein